MDLSFSQEEEAFRQQVRSFLQECLPQDLREHAYRGWPYQSQAEQIAWQRILFEKGWIAPSWPKELGGAGWTAVQRHIFQDECGKVHTPRVSPFGLTMVGPVIYTYGTEEQKRRFIPRILRSEDWWCQGYSEPEAGSDLASLQTSAVRDGDEYVVNGRKAWISDAHIADMMCCLVRTDPEVKPQAGITFLLVDMKTPGITVNPVMVFDGHESFCDVFFDDVRIPIENRVGDEGQGWTYAKFLMTLERTGLAYVGRAKARLERLREIARDEVSDGKPLVDDPWFELKLAESAIDLLALEYTNLRYLAEESADRASASVGSVLKIIGTELEQRMNEMITEAFGYYAAPLEDSMRDPASTVEPIGKEHCRGMVAERLLRQAATIYGGTNEVQRNVIAKMALGL